MVAENVKKSIDGMNRILVIMKVWKVMVPRSRHTAPIHEIIGDEIAKTEAYAAEIYEDYLETRSDLDDVIRLHGVIEIF